MTRHRRLAWAFDVENRYGIGRHRAAGRVRSTQNRWWRVERARIDGRLSKRNLANRMPTTGTGTCESRLTSGKTLTNRFPNRHTAASAKRVTHCRHEGCESFAYDRLGGHANALLVVRGNMKSTRRLRTVGISAQTEGTAATTSSTLALYKNLILPDFRAFSGRANDCRGRPG